MKEIPHRNDKDARKRLLFAQKFTFHERLRFVRRITTKNRPGFPRDGKYKQWKTGYCCMLVRYWVILASCVMNLLS